MYICFWLALSILFSVICRHAATFAMLGIALWIFFALFMSLAGRTEVRLESCGKRNLRLRVKSEGNVIPKEQRKAVFRRFYRGDASRSSQDSYGLGLSIAQVIVKNHKGSLGLECEGERNCFYLRLKGRIHKG